MGVPSWMEFFWYLGQSTRDFDQVEPFREDPPFRLSLDLKEVPSRATLRQRLDLVAEAADWPVILGEESADLPHQLGVTLSPVTWRQNGQERSTSPAASTSRPSTTRTPRRTARLHLQRLVGYAPIFARLGREGYLVDAEPRGGSVESKTVDRIQRGLHLICLA